MNANDIKFTGEMQALALRPGDVLVLKTAFLLTEEMSARIQAALKAEFPGHKTLVLADGMSLGVLRPDVFEPSSIERKLDYLITALAGEEDDQPERTLDGEPAGRERDQNQGL